MRPRQSRLGIIKNPHMQVCYEASFNEAEAITPRNPSQLRRGLIEAGMLQ